MACLEVAHQLLHQHRLPLDLGARPGELLPRLGSNPGLVLLGERLSQRVELVEGLSKPAVEVGGRIRFRFALLGESLVPLVGDLSELSLKLGDLPGGRLCIALATGEVEGKRIELRLKTSILIGSGRETRSARTPSVLPSSGAVSAGGRAGAPWTSSRVATRSRTICSPRATSISRTLAPLARSRSTSSSRTSSRDCASAAFASSCSSAWERRSARSARSASSST